MQDLLSGFRTLISVIHVRKEIQIIHFFFLCAKVSDFWKEVCRWVRNSVNLYLHQITPKEFLFGLPSDAHKSKVINFILIRLRFYIFRQKLFHDTKLSCIQWLQEFKSALQVEQWICFRLGKGQSSQKWKDILNELG